MVHYLFRSEGIFIKSVNSFKKFILGKSKDLLKTEFLFLHLSLIILKSSNFNDKLDNKSKCVLKFVFFFGNLQVYVFPVLILLGQIFET